MTIIPFDDRDGWIWLDGKMVPWREAKLHVLTHGLHYGSSVFEGERAYNGQIFKTTEHSERLRISAQLLGFEVPYSVEELNEAKDAVLAKNGLTNAYVRPVAWRGSEMMAIAAQQTTTHVAIAAWEWPSYFSPELKANGLKLQTAVWKRPDPKTAPVHSKAAGLYMICTMSKHEAERNGFHDAMMLDFEGNIAECTGANIFFGINGELHTPQADRFLNGITRRTVIELAKAQGITVVERRIRPEEMANAQEVFITGTAAEITRIGQIDNYTFKAGALTERLEDAYQIATGQKQAKAA
jgi:branched-chain amino acid aminotransferase